MYVFTYLIYLGLACQELNQWEEAISKLRQALEMKRILYQEVKFHPEIARACSLLAKSLLHEKEFEEALTYLQEALELHQNLQATNDVAECLIYTALCYNGLKKPRKAMETLGKFEKLYSTNKQLDKRIIFHYHQEMADHFIEGEFEDKVKGLHHLQEAYELFKQLEQTEADEATLNELQAKILSLQLK